MFRNIFYLKNKSFIRDGEEYKISIYIEECLIVTDILKIVKIRDVNRCKTLTFNFTESSDEISSLNEQGLDEIANKVLDRYLDDRKFTKK